MALATIALAFATLTLDRAGKMGRLKSWAGATLADQMVRDRCFQPSLVQ